MALELKPSDLYQNGRVIELDNGEELLIRDTLEVKQEAGDSYFNPTPDDRLPLLPFNAYEAAVENANQYWWLIADRNDVFNPMNPNIIINDGDLVELSDAGDIVIPNLLRQEPEIRSLRG